MNSQLSRRSLLDDFFRDMSPGFYVKPLHGEPLPDPGQIKIDVKENEKAYIVDAEVPGLSKEDIHVSLDGAMVMLQAEVKQHDAQTKDDKVLRSERYFGAISRSFQLPQEIDASQAQAKYDKGVLTLTLPKKQGIGSRRLKIE